MKIEGIGATTHVDRHNMKFTKGALEKLADDINNGSKAAGVGLDHDVTVPPMGKVSSAYVEKRKDGEYQIIITQNIFDQYTKLELPDGLIVYKEELPDDKRPFSLNNYEDVPKKLLIHTDHVNFETEKEYDEFIKDVKEAGEFEEEEYFRKSVLPDPELLITLTHGLITYLAGKKIIDKTADKIIDKMTDDISNAYDALKKAVLSYAKYAIPKNRPITYIFEVPGDPIIEFIVRTTDANIALSAILPDNISSCFKKADHLLHSLTAEKIQYILNDNQEWEFNYLLTKNGEVIGTPASHKRREKRMELLKQNVKDKNKNMESK